MNMEHHMKFAEIGSNVEIYPYVVFIKAENIYLKNHIILSEFCWLHGGKKTVIGNFIHIANYSSIAGGGVCLLEDFVGISAGVRIVTGSEMINGEGLTNPTVPKQYRACTRSFVHLKKHSFLATNVIVHPGVTIGEGAVVGSNSVVTKDIEPWTINVGIPAKPIKDRDNRKIYELEKKMYDEFALPRWDISKFLELKKNSNKFPDSV